MRAVGGWCDDIARRVGNRVKWRSKTWVCCDGSARLCVDYSREARPARGGEVLPRMETRSSMIGTVDDGARQIKDRSERDPGVDDMAGVGTGYSSRRKCWSLILMAKQSGLGKDGLPKFSFFQHTYMLATGLRRDKERKGEEKRQEEQNWTAYRAEKEQKTAMFTTPGPRPLAIDPLDL